MFWRAIFLDMILNMFRSCSHRISGIDYLHNYIWRVENLVKFCPNSLWLSCFHSSIPSFISNCLVNTLLKIDVLLLIVFLVFLFIFLKKSAVISNSKIRFLSLRSRSKSILKAFYFKKLDSLRFYILSFQKT